MAAQHNLRNQPCPVDPEWLGAAGVSPQGRFPVSMLGTWTVTYRAGRYGVDDGGAILLTARIDDASTPQLDDPAATGYVTVATTGQVRLDTRYQPGFWVRPWSQAIVVTVRDGSLAEGDTVTITLGDTSGGSAGWRLQSFPERRHRFAVLVDAFGTGEFYPLPDQPAIEIVPGDAAAVEVILPSRVRAGEPVRGHVRVCDRHGNPVRGRGGRAAVSCDGGADGLPAEVELDDGVTPFGPVTFRRPGVVRLTVSCRGMTGRSDPVEVCPGAKAPLALYWADMHGQTEETVGTGTVAEYFDFARRKALLDVAAWQGNDFQITDALWREVQRRTADAHEPGAFVTFLGYEWSGLTPAGGDHNILFLRDDAQIHRSSHWQIHDGSDASTDRYPITDLWREFRDRDDVLAVAHVGGRYANLDLAAGQFPNLVEIHSHHGTFEWLAEDAMRRGLCVGFVGQSDDHTGRPGLSAPLQPMSRTFVTFDVAGGYTGLFAEQLTREAVWRALKARHCYATTGRRILLDVRAAGAMMGDVVEWPCGKPLEVAIRAAGHGAAIWDLEVRRDDSVVHRHGWPGDETSPWLRIEWSGVRTRSRNKVANWSGRLVVPNAAIEEFIPYAFDQEGQGVVRIDRHTLGVVSTTSGDIDGVLLRLSSSASRLVFESASGTVEFPAGGALREPMSHDVGVVNQRVAVSRMRPELRSDDLSAAWSDTVDRPGRRAYWVKVVQADGHMAWSSPIFVDFRS